MKEVSDGRTEEVPDGLRARAVRLYRSSTPRSTFRQLGEQLDVHHEALRNSVRQAEAGECERDDRPTSTENKEVRRLRKENAELEIGACRDGTPAWPIARR